MAPKKPTEPQRSGLYPSLEDAGQFRLHKISEIRHDLENEVAQRDKLRRKYKTLWNAFYNVAQVSGALAIGSGAGERRR